MVKPSTLSVRFRQEGHKAWIERNYTNPAEQITIIEQFWYGTTYEFIGRLVYDSRVGVFCPIVKTPSPGKLFFSLSTMGDHKSKFVFALGCLCKCMRNKSRLAAILFLCRANLHRFDARIWPHFHVKTCGHTSPLSSPHKLTCRPHFLICDYCY